MKHKKPDQELVLKAKEATLKIRLMQGDVGTIQCFLLNKENLYIGSERTDYFFPRLIQWLTSARHTDPRRIISLLETHIALFGITDQQHRYLLFQDKNSNFFACLTLTFEDCQSWRRMLESFGDPSGVAA